MSTVISVENLGKKYTLRHQQRESYRALRDVLTDGVASIGQRLLHPFRRSSAVQQVHEEFWALKNISFEVKQGDRIGIIGRNGAGKSTLLKILSRITEPTTGKVKIKGRVASLLEVGTGFHPELTGRENIYLNGAILGMSRVEIKKKFDEIVAFAEIEKFLDTPVKRYSSGMYVRLAFAVAAHLEPEILLVDEVLAVGDIQFQKKCLGKMGEVAQGGKTVLFVSHNMVAINKFCNKAILLTNGTLKSSEKVESAIDRYTKESMSTAENTNIAIRIDRKGSQWLKFHSVSIYNSQSQEINKAISGQNINIRIFYKSERILCNASVMVSFNIRNENGYLLTNPNSVDTGNEILDIFNEGYFECELRKFNLRSGRYECNLFCRINGDIVDWIQSAFILIAEDGDFYKTGKLTDRSQGDVLLDCSWRSCDNVQ